MSAREWADPDVAPLGGDAQARALAQVRREVAPSGAMALADASGRYYWWACLLCHKDGITRTSKQRAQAEASDHNANWHDGREAQ